MWPCEHIFLLDIKTFMCERNMRYVVQYLAKIQTHQQAGTFLWHVCMPPRLHVCVDILWQSKDMQVYMLKNCFDIGVNVSVNWCLSLCNELATCPGFTNVSWDRLQPCATLQRISGYGKWIICEIWRSGWVLYFLVVSPLTNFQKNCLCTNHLETMFIYNFGLSVTF